jgi:hypothetical protein
VPVKAEKVGNSVQTKINTKALIIGREPNASATYKR